MNNIEDLIIRSLLTNKSFFGKAFSKLDDTLFASIDNIYIYNEIKKYSDKYTEQPSLKEVGLLIKSNNSITNEAKGNALAHFKAIFSNKEVVREEFLLDQAENWIKKQKLTNAILKSSELLGEDDKFEEIQGLVEEALSVTFDSHTGMSYQKSIKDRIEYYHTKLKGLSSGIPLFDEKTGGGFMKKTLSIISGASHSGKCLHGDTKLNISMSHIMIELLDRKKIKYKRI